MFCVNVHRKISERNFARTGNPVSCEKQGVNVQVAGSQGLGVMEKVDVQNRT